MDDAEVGDVDVEELLVDQVGVLEGDVDVEDGVVEDALVDDVEVGS